MKNQLSAAESNSAKRTPPKLRSTRLIPASDWPKHHDWPPIGGLRHLIFNARWNGFNAAMKRVGRRVLIDEAAFFAWVEAQQGEIK